MSYSTAGPRSVSQLQAQAFTPHSLFPGTSPCCFIYTFLRCPRKVPSCLFVREWEEGNPEPCCSLLGTFTWNEMWPLGGGRGLLPAWGPAEHVATLCLHVHPSSPTSLPQHLVSPSIPLPSPFLEADGVRLEVQLWKRKSTRGKKVEPWENLLTTCLFWAQMTDSCLLFSCLSLLPTVPRVLSGSWRK